MKRQRRNSRSNASDSQDDSIPLFENETAPANGQERESYQSRLYILLNLLRTGGPRTKAQARAEINAILDYTDREIPKDLAKGILNAMIAVDRPRAPLSERQRERIGARIPRRLAQLTKFQDRLGDEKWNAIPEASQQGIVFLILGLNLDVESYLAETWGKSERELRQARRIAAEMEAHIALNDDDPEQGWVSSIWR